MLEPADKGKLNKQVIKRGILGPLLVIPLVFLPAGTVMYWQGVLYILLVFAVIILNYLMLRNNPELIKERLAPGEGMKLWDKAFFALSIPSYLAIVILSSLDAARFGLTHDLPFYFYILSVFLYILGQLIFIWAKRTNQYFSSVVRIQKDRGHKVCQEGPYRYVRHPGYSGSLLYTITTPLILGSLWGLIPAGLSIVLLMIRTYLEDRTLERELEGYKAYKAKVRYRLLPYIW